MRFLVLVPFLLFLSLSSCVHKNAAPKAEAPRSESIERADEDNLTQAFASIRKEQVRSVAYDLTFTLTKGSDEYRVSTIVDVDLARIDQPLSLDLVAKSVDKVVINGNETKDFRVRKGSLEIPAALLKEKSRIEISTVGTYSKDGHGFQRIVDPADKAEYIYTDFEPYRAHTMFPCFDQPDLKAKVRVTIQAPKDWKPLANSVVESSVTNGDQMTTRFREMVPISTYLFFVGAGPFVEWKDSFGDLPLVLYARKSLASFVDHRQVMETTKKGLQFFNEYFGYPYPFPKYGHVFAPEFAWGGMENPGMVTLSERYIRRGKMLPSQKSDFDSLILHEMAHMWFGDLVTMAWWNDLWLNESFATYAAALALDRGLKNPDAWADFHATKSWGYHQDQLVTTHPIEGAVEDTRTGKGNFDGITYGKGASALKQLHFFVGEEGFKKGLQSYFAKYAFKNTVRKNFIDEISAASGRDLNQWTTTWLQTAGPQRVQVNWSCDAGRIKAIEIEQTASVSKTLAPHRTRVGLYKLGTSGKLGLSKTQDVTFEGGKTFIPTLVGEPCPDFIYGNVDDHDYALYSLDPVSLKLARNGLSGGFAEPILRLMVWRTLYQMMMDAKITAGELFENSIPAFASESNTAVLAALLGRHSPVREAYFHYLTPEDRSRLAPSFEKTIWSRATDLEFFDFYVSIASSPAALGRLKTFLDGQGLPKGVKLDQDRRWSVIHTMARENYPGISGIVSTEERRDPTTVGQRNAFAARVAVPNAAAKRKFWTELLSPEKIPFSTLRWAARNFHAPDHPELSKTFVQDYFSRLKTMDWSANDTYVGIYFDEMFPYNLCSEALLKQSEETMKVATKMTALSKRGWLEANDELRRCISIRGLAQAKAR